MSRQNGISSAFDTFIAAGFTVVFAPLIAVVVFPLLVKEVWRYWRHGK